MGAELVEVTTDSGEMVSYDLRLASIPFLSNEDMEQFTIAKVFNATSLATAMDTGGDAEKLSDYAGKTITIHGAGLRPSSVDGRSGGVFAVIDAEVEGGSHVIITTGATQPLAVIARAYSEKSIPVRVKVYEATPSKKGQNGQLFFIDPDRF
jgi:hypothetical protein